jgi:hypothetical protein
LALDVVAKKLQPLGRINSLMLVDRAPAQLARPRIDLDRFRLKLHDLGHDG